MFCLIIMGIMIYNISATTARVNWPPTPGCLDTFYSVMYDPNWNSLLMGYKRKSFKHEERIPVSQTSTYLASLIPQTTYFMCVTCQAADPARDQCQVFNTLSGRNEAQARAGWELAMGVWMASSILLLLISGILLWGCLRSVCPIPCQTTESRHVSTTLVHPDVSGCVYNPSSSDYDTKLPAVIQNPFLSSQTTGPRLPQDRELMTLTQTKLSGSESI